MSPAEKLRSIGVNPADVHIDAAPVIARRLAALEKVVGAAKLLTDHMLGPSEAMFASDVAALRTALDALDAEVGHA